MRLAVLVSYFVLLSVGVSCALAQEAPLRVAIVGLEHGHVCRVPEAISQPA